MLLSRTFGRQEIFQEPVNHAGNLLLFMKLRFALRESNRKRRVSNWFLSVLSAICHTEKDQCSTG
jgi:hypothetical protein